MPRRRGCTNERMTLGRLTVLVAVLMSVVMLHGAAPASAWRYTFKSFLETSNTAQSIGVTFVKRCAPGQAGDWRFISRTEVETSFSSEPKPQILELEARAKMPITPKFRPVHDVDVRWSATLPKDPDLAALLTEHYDRLAQGQTDFYEGMSVRWRPAKEKLDIRHSGLFYDDNQQLAPGKFTTAFKPKPGC
jgi:hypothetical protein